MDRRHLVSMVKRAHAGQPYLEDHLCRSGSYHHVRDARTRRRLGCPWSNHARGRTVFVIKGLDRIWTHSASRLRRRGDDAEHGLGLDILVLVIAVVPLRWAMTAEAAARFSRKGQVMV